MKMCRVCKIMISREKKAFNAEIEDLVRVVGFGAHVSFTSLYSLRTEQVTC